MIIKATSVRFLVAGAIVSMAVPFVSGSALEASETKYPSDVPLVWPASVTRKSVNRDQYGRYHAPWTSATVEVVMPRPVKAGDAVTVLPLKAGLPASQRRAKTVEAQPAVDEYPATWLVDIDVSEPSFFAAQPDQGRGDDTPFDAVVVYPSVPKARLISGSAIISHALPKAKGCSTKTLWAAIDLQSDGEPDVTIFRFCCDRPTTAWDASGAEPCDSLCEKIYLRRPGPTWRLVHEEAED